MRNTELRLVHQSQMDYESSGMGGARETLANQERWLDKEGHILCTAGLQKESRK